MSVAHRANQRPKKLKAPAPRRSAKRRWAVTLLALPLLVALAVLARSHFGLKPPSPTISSAAVKAKQFPAIEQLLAMSPADLEKCDIALIDLVCAQGLRGSENLDIAQCLKVLDGWAEQVKWETQRHAYRYNEHPEEYKHSLGRYRMNMLGAILVQDLGIHYNPDRRFELAQGKLPTMAWNADSKDIFIHGLLSGKHEGTCSSMPVLYVAIGRRLGYPVNLATCKMHVYVRYEEPNGGHFNVEATMETGFLTPTEEDYTRDIFQCTPEEVRGFGWLRPISNAEAFGDLLLHRGSCLALVRRYREAGQTFAAAWRYFADTPQEREAKQEYMHDLDLAPFGDKVDDLRNEVKNLSVPDGPKFAYFHNRKEQVNYFLGANTNWPSMEMAVNDLERELAAYRKELTSSPAVPGGVPVEENAHVLELTAKSGKRLLLPAAGLPPPLNRGVIPAGFLESISWVDLEDEGLVWDTLWTHYKKTTPGWMAQASQLPMHPPIPENQDQDFRLTPSP
jgi:hypothetical protein